MRLSAEATTEIECAASSQEEAVNLIHSANEVLEAMDELETRLRAFESQRVSLAQSQRVAMQCLDGSPIARAEIDRAFALVQYAIARIGTTRRT